MSKYDSGDNGGIKESITYLWWADLLVGKGFKLKSMKVNAKNNKEIFNLYLPFSGLIMSMSSKTMAS